MVPPKVMDPSGREKAPNTRSNKSGAHKAEGDPEADDAPINMTELTSAIQKVMMESLSNPEVIQVLSRSLSDDVVQRVTGKLQDSLAHNTELLQSIENKIESTMEKVNKLESDVSVLKSKVKPIDGLVTEVRRLETNMSQETDDIRQYLRRNNLRIFGIPESNDESTDQLVLKVARDIDVPMKLSDIDRSHRVGKPGGQHPRAVLCKFVSYAVRRQFIAKRRQLKGSSVSIKEDLCRARLVLFNHAVTKYGMRNVWTNDGDILVNNGNKIQRISSMSQLNQGN